MARVGRLAEVERPRRCRGVPYHPLTARRLAKVASDAYLSKADLGETYGSTPYQSFQFFEGKGTIVDTQAFIVSIAQCAVLAFRGTESLQDLITDFLLAKSICVRWLRVPELKVHKGFCAAYSVVRPRVISAIRLLKPGQVYLTGHSLGGALATIAALDINLEFPGIQVTMYNFGSPRVGNPVFARLYDRNVADSHRVVHSGDFVTKTPPGSKANHIASRFPGVFPVARLLKKVSGYQHVCREHMLARHRSSNFPHHDMKYYLDQLKN